MLPGSLLETIAAAEEAAERQRKQSEVFQWARDEALRTGIGWIVAGVDEEGFTIYTPNPTALIFASNVWGEFGRRYDQDKWPADLNPLAWPNDDDDSLKRVKHERPNDNPYPCHLGLRAGQRRERPLQRHGSYG